MMNRNSKNSPNCCEYPMYAFPLRMTNTITLTHHQEIQLKASVALGAYDQQALRNKGLALD